MMSLLGTVAVPAFASSIPQSSCDPNTGECNVYEGSSFQDPNFNFLAGDVVLLDADGAYSDVLRFYNNLIDTGGGTGLGNAFTEFSADEGNSQDGISLNSLTLSANAVFLSEAAAVEGAEVTDYVGSSGLLFHIYSDSYGGVPEPSAMAFLSSGLLFVVSTVRRRKFQN